MKKTQITLQFLLIVILLTTTFLHLWQLSNVPPGVSNDEALYGLDAIWLSETGGFYVFLPSSNGRESLFPYLASFAFRVLGVSSFALRIFPAISGILSVALTYGWVRFMFPPSRRRNWIAVLAAVFAATSFWGIQMHRVGFRASLLPVLAVTSYYFFWRGHVSKRFYNFAISGFFLGLGISVYIGGRLLPFIFVLFALWVYKRIDKQEALFIWKGLAIVGVVSLIVFSPLGLYFLRHPDLFFYRSKQLIYEDSNTLQYLIDGIRFFVDKGGTNWQFNVDDIPLIPGILPLFFWLGVCFTIIKLLRKDLGYTFLFLSFVVPISQILFAPPSPVRLNSAIPPTSVLIGIGLYTPLDWILTRTKISTLFLNTIIVVTVLILSLRATFFLYFERYAHEPIVMMLNDEPFYSIGEYIEEAVLEKKQSLLIPHQVLFSPPLHFFLKKKFDMPLLVENETLLIKNQTIKVLWPPRWWSGLNELSGFVLLSPALDDQRGHIEMVGQWEQEQFDFLFNLIPTRGTYPTTEIVHNGLDQPIAFSIDVERDVVINVLHSVPKNLTNINFDNQVTLLGYDYILLPDDNLDISIFWKSQIYTDEEYAINLEVISSQGKVLGRVKEHYIAASQFWHPGQLIIEHYTVKLNDTSSTDTYNFTIELFKIISQEKLPAFTQQGIFIEKEKIPVTKLR